MNLLLTGGNGFLGKQIFNTLSNSVIISNLSRSNSDINVDLSREIPEFNGFYEIVIHSAGLAHISPKSKDEIESFNAINVMGTSNLLKGLNKFPPKRFVFVSSVSVYGLIEGEKISENSKLAAIDPYGKSKIIAEELVLKWCKENKVVCTILRLPLLVGRNPPGNLGFMIKGIKKGFYFNISGGKSKKSMVLASDVAKFILDASKIGGIYNLTDGYHPSFCELSQYISHQLGIKYLPNISMFFAKIIAFIGDMAGSKFPLNSDKLDKITSTLTFDDSKARKAFGWNPTPILDGFKI